MSDISLLGYCDKLSGRPGDEISFKVSSNNSLPYVASLVRVVCADPNPEGPGFTLEKSPIAFGGRFQSRYQPFYPGSYGLISARSKIKLTTKLSLSTNIWPTTPEKDNQGIISFCDQKGKPVFCLSLEKCLISVLVTTGPNQTKRFVVPTEIIKPRNWYYIWVDLSINKIQIGIKDYKSFSQPSKFVYETQIEFPEIADIVLAAVGGHPVTGHFNGKIDSPKLYQETGSPYIRDDKPNKLPNILADWNFSLDMTSTKIIDQGPLKLNGILINMPTRAMTGPQWTGEEMAWRHAPEQYGAIHFHDDDIYDFGWETDFKFKIPTQMKSGLYAAVISCCGNEDFIPFFVCPPQGKRNSRLCVLASTFTYTIYGNHARPNFHSSWLNRIKEWNAYPWNPAVHKEYGLSTYNFHTDGSGICHANHKRPIFSLKPGYITFGETEGKCSGLRHLQADTHFYFWLEKLNIPYDIITDQELHDEGIDAISGYHALSTGTHPEYHTTESLNAIQEFRDQGGNLLYLGGNGFYWKIATHKEGNGTLEIRRNEGGIRAWAAEPGEYYHAFDGGYGGLWRRNNRPPQKLAGVGFTAQGNFHGSYYRIDPDALLNEATAWIFEGVKTDIVGNYGFSGNGAAGFELDRADYRLGTEEETKIIARSENHHESFVPVPEELLTHITTWSGETPENLIRADMVYQQSLNGSQLFSVGSITFCGSLLFNDGSNDISTIVKNILARFME